MSATLATVAAPMRDLVLLAIGFFGAFCWGVWTTCAACRAVYHVKILRARARADDAWIRAGELEFANNAARCELARLRAENHALKRQLAARGRAS